MKLFLCVNALLSFYAGTIFAQPLIKSWDKNIAGYSSDVPVSFQQLADSSFVLLANSRSGIGFDKSQPNRDSTGSTGDFWLIRLDKSGNIIWEKTYGGPGNDVPAALVVLPNGFIMAGTSSSGVGGEKTDSLRGVFDYWVIAVDTNGVVQWDKTIGGPLQDQLNAMVLTTDFKLFLSGWTLSGVGGDKLTPLLGDFDYWLVKMDLSGNFILENTLGGIQADNCYAMVPTGGGGALLAGYSNSPISFSKTEISRGGFDYWVVRVDSLGRRLWDKTIGGPGDDFAFAVAEHPGSARGFLIGGDSFSGTGGEKSQGCRGGDDYWLVYMAANGNFVWDKTFGGTDYDELNSIRTTANKQILLSGESYSPVSGEKSEPNLGAEQIWMVLVDTTGQLLFDKTFFTTGHDEYTQAVPTADHCFMGITYTAADTGGYRSHNNLGGGDIWLCKLCYAPVGLAPQMVSDDLLLYPNPAEEDVVVQLTDGNLLSLQIEDINGRKLFAQDMIKKESRLDISYLKAGIYFITVWTEKGSVTKKLLKL